MNITAPKEGNGALAMDATARTYRYLDPTEVESVRKSNDKSRPGAK
jgi:type IV pilus assembly protein PilO